MKESEVSSKLKKKKNKIGKREININRKLRF